MIFVLGGNNMTELTFTTSNMLLHHGIEGQKWGVQNGPPYPLDKTTAKEVKKNKQKKN